MRKRIGGKQHTSECNASWPKSVLTGTCLNLTPGRFKIFFILALLSFFSLFLYPFVGFSFAPVFLFSSRSRRILVLTRTRVHPSLSCRCGAKSQRMHRARRTMLPTRATSSEAPCNPEENNRKRTKWPVQGKL